MAQGEKERLIGNIEKRGEGKYRLSVSCGFAPDGTRIRKRKTVSAKNDREAEKKLAEFISEVERGSFVDPTKLSFKDFAELWLKEYARPNLAPKTYHRYKEMLESRIMPALGHARIDQIEPLHLVQFQNSLRQDGIRLDGKAGGLSERTILHHHHLLSVLFNTAVDWSVLKNNPLEKVKKPSVTEKDAPAYDEQQAAVMLACLEGEPIKYRVLVHLALTTGCRKSELMALEWSDIDFIKGTIYINKSRQYCPDEGVHERDCAKNESSERIITLPRITMNLLLIYRAEQEASADKIGDLWQGSSKLFTTWDGKDMFPDSGAQWFTKFIEKHKLPELNFHGLRHTAATVLINQGVNIKAVSARMGHARTSTTVDIYAKALRSADRACADAMDSLFQKAEKEGSGPKTVPKSNIIQLVNKS